MLVAACQLEVEPEAGALQPAASQPTAKTETTKLAIAAAGRAAPELQIAAGSPALAPASQPRAAGNDESGRPAQPQAQAGAPAAAPPAPPLPNASADMRPAAPAAATPPPAANATNPAVDGCKPGVYVGTFNGSLELVQLASLSSITGTIRADLSQDGAEALVLKNARVVGVDKDENAFTANLTGRLNCATHELENGKLESGTYRMKALAADAAFRGETTAKHLADPPSTVGTWQATADGLIFLGGRGTWNLVLDDSSAK